MNDTSHGANRSKASGQRRWYQWKALWVVAAVIVVLVVVVATTADELTAPERSEARATDAVPGARGTTGTAPGEPGPATPPPAPPRARDGPAPVGDQQPGTWYSPPADRFSADIVWFFDPVGEAIPYGWRRDHQPTGAAGSAQRQFSFVYTTAGSNQLALSYSTGARQALTLLAYDPQTDILHVDWAGHEQAWFGCRSGRLPAHALASCR